MSHSLEDSVDAHLLLDEIACLTIDNRLLSAVFITNDARLARRHGLAGYHGEVRLAKNIDTALAGAVELTQSLVAHETENLNIGRSLRQLPNLLKAVAVLGLVFIVALTGLVLQWIDGSLYLWATIGFLTNPMSMTYLALSQRFDPGMAARVTTGINALVLVGSFLIQWLVGRIIALWEPLAPGIYPREAFRVSFALVLGCVVLAWLWYVTSLFGRGSNHVVAGKSQSQGADYEG